MAKTYSLTRSCDTTSQSINQSEAIQSGINDTVTVRSTKQCYSTEKDRWVFSRCWNDRRVDADDVTSSRSEFQCRSSSHVLTFPISKLSLPSPSHDQRNSFMNHQWGHVPRGRWVFYKRAFSAHTQKRTQAPVFSTAFCTSANSWSTISQNDTQHLSWTQSSPEYLHTVTVSTRKTSKMSSGIMWYAARVRCFNKPHMMLSRVQPQSMVQPTRDHREVDIAARHGCMLYLQ